MSQQNQKTEMVDINELLKAEGIRTEEEPTPEIQGEDVFKSLVQQEETEEEIPPTEEEPTPPATTQPKTTIYADKLKDYISAGFLEDVSILMGEGEEAKETFLSELEDVDEDTYNAILVQYKEAKDKEIKEKYISREGLDERTEKYIELKKAGGDISKLIETEIQYVNPLSQFNLEDESHQEALVRQSLQAQGLKPRVIEAQIQELKEEMSLDLEAKKIAKTINDEFDAFVDNKKQEQLAAIEAEKAEQKEFRKNMGIALKSLIPDENISKLILDNTTKKGEYGLTNTDQLFFDAQKDPEKFAEVALLLNNREAFIKTLTAKAELKSTKKTVSTLLTINPSTVKAVKKETPPKTEGDAVFEKLTSQFKQ